MHTTLTIQEAFAARQAGKTVVCRHAESEVFETLNNVSAETWFDPHYIFALQIETITLGAYVFTKPYTLDELTLNDDVYYVGASGTILKGKFNPENEMLVSAVKNGSVQRDEENAILQMNAFRSLLNIEAELPEIVDYDFFVVDGESPKPETKKRRGGRKSKDTQPAAENKSVNAQDTSQLNDDQSKEIDHTDPAVSKYIDAISAAGSNAELVQIEDNIIDDDHKFLHDDLNLFRELITQKRQVFKKIKAETQLAAFKDNLNDASTVEDLNALAIKVESLGDIHPDLEEDFYILSVDIAAKLEKLNQIDFIDQEQQHDNDPKGVVNTFTVQINEAKNIADLKKVELEINKFWSLNETDRLDLKHRLKFRREELEMQSGSISELKELQKDAMNLSQYESQLSDLINHVQNAQTVDEANEPVTQTLDWTVEQRLPLITAISKRLCELGKPLIAQIREANDLNTLDVYLKQIHELIAVDGTLAHQCMQAYTVRKSALSLASPA